MTPTISQNNGCKTEKGAIVNLKKTAPIQYHQTKREPVINSTTGYEAEIVFLQHLDFLFKNIKDKSGILSYQAIFFWQ